MNDSSISIVDGITQRRRELRQMPMSTLIERSEEAQGIDTRQLRAGDTLEVETRNSCYTLRLSDPARGTASARGDGDFLNEDSDVGLLGATLSGRGTLLKTGWILRGYRMVLSIPGSELVTSPVARVLLNGTPLFASSRIH